MFLYDPGDPLFEVVKIIVKVILFGTERTSEAKARAAAPLNQHEYFCIRKSFRVKSLESISHVSSKLFLPGLIRF